jgi:hypothetical protein
MADILDDRLRRLVAEANAGAYIPPPDPTGSEGQRIMATKVKMAKGKEFEFAPATGGFATKYPWDQWLNGDLLLLERSEGPENSKGTIEQPTVTRDYGVPNNAMHPKLQTAARRRYKVVNISRRDADGARLKDSLIIRARDMTPDERATEDILRAEEKAARANTDGDGSDSATSL